MIVTIIAFTIAFLSTLAVGKALTKALYHKIECKSLMTLDVYVVSGIMAFTVYSQLISLFMPVSFVAFVIMGIIVVFSLFYLLKQDTAKRLYSDLKTLFTNVSIVHVVLLIFVIVTCILWTCDVPKHYDTYLYHAQSIRWIEKYGIVKGIGNLHNRLAYNSSFMCFQALFSFSFVFNPSLHIANGFISLVFMAYAVISNNIVKKRNIALSDFFKAVTVIYVCINAQYMSSCQTDDLALLLFVYIVTKWAEMYEKNVKNIHEYAYLCILGVFSATVKISSVTLVLLSVYPVYIFIKEKHFGEIVKYVISALIVSIPWLVRSVLISGYLLYPYASIDLFRVAWKMPKSVLVYDADEITAWAKGVYNVDLAHISIFKWFPLWFTDKDLSQKLLIIVGFASMFFIIGMLAAQVKAFVSKKSILEDRLPIILLYLYSIIALVFWFLSAPLYRYGCVFLMIPTVIFLYEIWNFTGHKIIKAAIYAVVVLHVLFTICIFGAKIGDKEHIYIKKAADYEILDAEEVDWNGVVMYCPQGTDQIGYSYFPAAISKETLNGLELIGSDLKAGIKHK